MLLSGLSDRFILTPAGFSTCPLDVTRHHRQSGPLRAQDAAFTWTIPPPPSSGSRLSLRRSVSHSHVSVLLDAALLDTYLPSNTCLRFFHPPPRYLSMMRVSVTARPVSNILHSCLLHASDVSSTFLSAMSSRASTTTYLSSSTRLCPYSDLLKSTPTS